MVRHPFREAMRRRVIRNLHLHLHLRTRRTDVLLSTLVLVLQLMIHSPKLPSENSIPWTEWVAFGCSTKKICSKPAVRSCKCQCAQGLGRARGEPSCR